MEREQADEVIEELKHINGNLTNVETAIETQTMLIKQLLDVLTPEPKVVDIPKPEKKLIRRRKTEVKK